MEAPGDGVPRPYEETLPDDVHPPLPPQPPTRLPEREADRSEQSAPPLPKLGVAPAKEAWRQYAVAAPAINDRPIVAVVIDDLGIDRRRTARAIGLRAPLTLSFLTYANGLDEQTAVARSAGHELLLHVGMEPSNTAVDPGPNVLLTGLDETELRRRLAWGLTRFKGFVGINNHMGSRFTSDPGGMAVVMDELSQRGLLFLDSRTTPESVGEVLARRYGVPSVERNVFLDTVDDAAAVRSRLAEVEALAKKAGYVVAIGHPRDATLDALQEWLEGLEARGVALVPLTAVVARRLNPNWTGDNSPLLPQSDTEGG